MNRILLLIALLPCSLMAQTVISPNTTFTVANNTAIATDGSFFNRSANTSFLAPDDATNNGGLAFVGQNQVFNTVEPLIIPNLLIDGGGVKSTLGVFLVSNRFFLQNGLVATSTFNGDNYIGMLPNASFNDDLDGSSYVVGPLVHLGTGDKFFPLGALVAQGQAEYAPTMMENIQGDANTAIAMQAFRNNGDISFKNLPDNLDSISQSWFWGIYGTSIDRDATSRFASADVTIPVQAEDVGMVAAGNLKYVIMEADTAIDDGSGPMAEVLKNLGGFGSTLDGIDAVDSEDPLLNPSVGEEYVRLLALGTVSTLEPIIHNIITPNGDGNNDYLVIENLAAFGTSELLMVDRYGVEVFSAKNYESPQADSQEGQDFSFLPPGNYICILKYNNGDNTAKQTISVIK